MGVDLDKSRLALTCAFLMCIVDCIENVSLEDRFDNNIWHISSLCVNSNSQAVFCGLIMQLMTVLGSFALLNLENYSNEKITLFVQDNAKKLSPYNLNTVDSA